LIGQALSNAFPFSYLEWQLLFYLLRIAAFPLPSCLLSFRVVSVALLVPCQSYLASFVGRRLRSCQLPAEAAAGDATYLFMQDLYYFTT
jgi:hypothetical protein